MNHIYKVVWSKVKNCYVVVSEIARNGGKEHSRHAKKMPGGVYILPLALALNFGLPSSSQAAQAAEDTTIDLGNDGSTSYDGKGDLVIGNEETVATSDATKADKEIWYTITRKRTTRTNSIPSPSIRLPATPLPLVRRIRMPSTWPSSKPH